MLSRDLPVELGPLVVDVGGKSLGTGSAHVVGHTPHLGGHRWQRLRQRSLRHDGPATRQGRPCGGPATPCHHGPATRHDGPAEDAVTWASKSWARYGNGLTKVCFVIEKPCPGECLKMLTTCRCNIQYCLLYFNIPFFPSGEALPKEVEETSQGDVVQWRLRTTPC